MRPQISNGERTIRSLAGMVRFLVLTLVTSTAWCSAISETSAQTSARQRKAKRPPQPKWTDLFDGKTLKGWNVTKFGGEGQVLVKKGQLILEMGADLTGVTTKHKVPRSNYEVELEAMRVDGTDFFCALTFPVKKDHCSLIVGGWGGGVCGLSSLDWMDASENETTTFRTFKNGRWYRIRLRVTDDKIEAWIDKKKIVDADITDKKISVRIEVELSKPFGLASWQTTAALRNIRLRKLQPTAKAKGGKSPK